jgi:hypothetical protein
MAQANCAGEVFVLLLPVKPLKVLGGQLHEPNLSKRGVYMFVDYPGITAVGLWTQGRLHHVFKPRCKELTYCLLPWVCKKASIMLI